jgi:hypothetical protein
LVNPGLFVCETRGNIKKTAFLNLAKTNEFVKVGMDCLVKNFKFSFSPPYIGVSWHALLAGAVYNRCNLYPIRKNSCGKTIVFFKVQSILNHEKILGNGMLFGLRNMKLFVRIGTRLRD